MLLGSQPIATSPANLFKLEHTEGWKDDSRKVFQISISNSKDYVVKTRWRAPSVHMYLKEKKKKKKERNIVN